MGVDTRVGVWEVAWARRVAGVGVCAGVCGGVRSTFEEIVQEASLFHAHHHHARQIVALPEHVVPAVSVLAAIAIVVLIVVVSAIARLSFKWESR